MEKDLIGKLLAEFEYKLEVSDLKPSSKEWVEIWFKPFLIESITRAEEEAREQTIKKIRDGLIAESTIGEHTMVVFDDLISSLTKERKDK